MSIKEDPPDRLLTRIAAEQQELRALRKQMKAVKTASMRAALEIYHPLLSPV